MCFSFSSFAQETLFSDHSLKAALKDYLQFYHEKNTPTKESETKPPVVDLEGRYDAIRYSESLAEVVMASGTKDFNAVLFEAMEVYLNLPNDRAAIAELMKQLKNSASPELQQVENHRFWKSSVLMAANCFYVLTAIEIIRAVGNKSGLSMRVVGWGRGLYERILKWGGNRSSAGLVRLGEAARTYGLDSQKLEKILGKPGLPRIIRICGVGLIVGLAEDGYGYHWTEQKMDPQAFFETVQVLAVLDLALRFYDFRAKVQKVLLSLSQERLLEFVKTAQTSPEAKQFWSEFRADMEMYKQLSLELKYFEGAVPSFYSNVVLKSDGLTDVEKSPLELFLEKVYVEYPQFQKLFETTEVHRRFSLALKKDNVLEHVSHVSLLPIKMMLEDTHLLLQKTEQDAVIQIFKTQKDKK